MRTGHAVDVERFLDCAFTAGERNVLRTKPRHAHVDGHLPVRFEPRHDQSARRLHADLALVGQAVVAHEHDEAARAVAALLDLAAVGVEDAVAEVRVTLRALDDEHLVAAHAEAAVGQRANRVRRQVDTLAHAVDDDEIVAQPLHLGELERHGGDEPARDHANSPEREKGSVPPASSVATPDTA